MYRLLAFLNLKLEYTWLEKVLLNEPCMQSLYNCKSSVNAIACIFLLLIISTEGHSLQMSIIQYYMWIVLMSKIMEMELRFLADVLLEKSTMVLI